MFTIYFLSIYWLCMCQCERLEGGMQKIAEASIQLDDLNAKLAVQKVVVAQKTEACEKLLEEISVGKLEHSQYTCFPKLYGSNNINGLTL